MKATNTRPSFPRPSRRQALAVVAAALASPAWLAARASVPAADARLVEVWKSPTCGCCQEWVKHLEVHGFQVRVHDSGNTAVRKRLGIAERFGSCHTATVGGYAIEGHVPAADIQRLLKERPRALGLAVPGMPIGSPGMDGPEYGGRRDPYDTLLLARDGQFSVYQSHR